MSGEFDSRKDSKSKFEQRPQMQGSTIDLKRVYISAYVLKNLGVHLCKVKLYAKSKKGNAIRVHHKQRMENPFDFRFS